jgi:membrane protease YdiL (CAAX protease family)
VIAVVPTIEELLYRGYAVERLSVALKSRAGAVVVSSIPFALAHAPTWGMGVALVLIVPALCHGAFYAWRRELTVNVLMHVATDALGFFLRAP